MNTGAQKAVQNKQKQVHQSFRNQGNSSEKVQGVGLKVNSPRVQNIVQEVNHEASDCARAGPEAGRVQGSDGD